jgi:Mrp family chromosome partitioning ATPase
VPPPHFPIETGEAAGGAPAPESAAPLAAAVTFQWPTTVRTLERQHGARFDQLAGHLCAVRDQRQVRVLLFTSCHRAEGRTTLILTLARALARRAGRTLVVDGDLSGPMLARQLGLKPRLGLEDVVLAGAPAGEAIVSSAQEGVAVLPLRAAVARPREFVAAPGWSVLMARLRREFELVLIDGSPLFTGLSAAVLHRSVDAAVLVYNRAVTGERALVRAQEVLEAGGIPILGLAETFV